MSSEKYSSASSLRSDGRKRKDVPPVPPAAYKRFRQDCSLRIYSVSHTSAEKSSGELKAGPDMGTSVSCVEDAPTPHDSSSSGSGRRQPLRSVGASWETGSSLWESSAYAATSIRSCTVGTFQSTEVTSSELQESAASFDPERRTSGKTARVDIGSQILSSKKRKFRATSTSVDDGRPELARRTLDPPAVEEVAEAPVAEVVKVEVKVTSSSQDDQIAPAPVYVLSSGRKSRPPEDPGKRPPTVDDEFDQYFSQLML